MNENEIKQEYEQEKRWEAYETRRDLIMQEFEMSYSNIDILKDMFENMTKEEIIEYVCEDDGEYLFEGDVFEEHKEAMMHEYCEHRGY